MNKTIDRALALMGNWYTIPIAVFVLRIFFQYGYAEDQTVRIIGLPLFGLFMMLIFILMGFHNMFFSAVQLGRSRAQALRLTIAAGYLGIFFSILADALMSVLLLLFYRANGVTVSCTLLPSWHNVVLYITGMIAAVSLFSLVNFITAQKKWFFVIWVAMIAVVSSSIGMYAAMNEDFPSWIRQMTDEGNIQVKLLASCALLVFGLLCYLLLYRLVKRYNLNK